MKRSRLIPIPCVILLLGMAPSWSVYAQQAPAEPPAVDDIDDIDAEAPPDDAIPEMPEEAPPPPDDVLAPSDVEAAEPPPPMPPEELERMRRKTWKDIVVLPRKAFLKRRRLELVPFIGTTINDTLIQHTALGGELNYFLTDILAIGVQGMYYISNVKDDEFNVRYHLGRVATLNEYRYSVTGNFSYIPIYGKFTVLNRPIFHYDIWLSGGVGVTNSKVIPRDFNNEAWSNMSLTFPIGIGARIHLTRWLGIHLAFRDYMMIDKFEQPGRNIPDAGEAKSQQSETQFINNIVFSAGVSFYFPWNFKYTTYR
jgi:outer membrane beta-barrel protein